LVVGDPFAHSQALSTTLSDEARPPLTRRRGALPTRLNVIACRLEAVAAGVKHPRGAKDSPQHQFRSTTLKPRDLPWEPLGEGLLLAGQHQRLEFVTVHCHRPGHRGANNGTEGSPFICFH